jgi:adenylate cyclase
VSAIVPGRPAVSLTLAQRAIDRREAITWRQGEDISKSIQELRTRYGMYAPLVWGDEVLGVLCVDNPQCEKAFQDDDLRLLLAVARYAAMSIANRKLQEEAQQNAAILARLLTNFSPNLRKILLERARHGKLRLGGQKSEVTILCSDIRGFTRLAATMDAAEIVDLLNDYLSKADRRGIPLPRNN